MPEAVTENEAVCPTVTVRFAGCWVIDGATGPPAPASSTSTQSGEPSLLLPGGVNACDPELANGEPAIDAKLPFAGSYQRAVTGPLSWARSTVNVRRVGM